MKDSAFFREENRKKQHAKEQQDLKYQLLLEDIKAVFGTAPGHRVLNWILGLCNVGTSIFTGNSQTFYNSGQQDIGHTITNHVIEADPAIYARLLTDKAGKLKARTTNKNTKKKS